MGFSKTWSMVAYQDKLLNSCELESELCNDRKLQNTKCTLMSPL